MFILRRFQLKKIQVIPCTFQNWKFAKIMVSYRYAAVKRFYTFVTFFLLSYRIYAIF